MKRLLSKRVLAAACLLLLALFLLRPDAGWMRARVSGSIAQALGRNVSIGSVRLQFLPRPGFDLQDLVVFDDPAFGAEPLLRASDVNASLRLFALLRGRIEVSRLSLSESSLNVTRDLRGRWNIEDLIERTAHTSLAPTGAARHIATPAFPYIEASNPLRADQRRVLALAGFGKHVGRSRTGPAHPDRCKSHRHGHSDRHGPVETIARNSSNAGTGFCAVEAGADRTTLEACLRWRQRLERCSPSIRHYRGNSGAPETYSRCLHR